jgi:uncharacterized protein (DUF1810 family)
MPKLQRFIDAQNGKAGKTSYIQALTEISKGEKKGHWIWYVFPQLQKLGHSEISKYFGIVDFEEACNYLQNKDLFERYSEITQAILKQLESGTALLKLMGSPIDANKLASSLTLFRAAAVQLARQEDSTQDYAKLVKHCDKIFKLIENECYFPCMSTLNAIKLKQPEKNRSFFAKEPLKPISQQELSGLSNKLASYISERENEWSFHYNFLGVMSLIYWLFDLLGKSDYYNNKSKEIKLSAAKTLKENIDNNGAPYKPLAPAEKEALSHGRLGALVSSYGGLDKIKQKLVNAENTLTTKFDSFQ